MTQEQKESFGSGILAGIIFTIIFIGFIGFISWKQDPVSTADPNYCINHPEVYTIDTIKTINNTDTTVVYKFRKL